MAKKKISEDKGPAEPENEVTAAAEGDENQNEETSEFSTSFKEFASGKPADDGQAAEAEGDDDGGDDDGTNDDDGAAEAVAEGKGDAGEDAAAAGAEPAPAAAGADPWAGAKLTDEQKKFLAEQKARLDFLAQFHDSNAGRVRGLTKALEDTRRELEKRGKNPTDAQISQALETPEDWQKFTKEYPKVGKAIESYINSRMPAAGATGLETRLEALETVAQADLTQGKLMLLAAPVEEDGYGHPDWFEVANSEQFKSWLNEQRPAVRSMFDSDDPADAAFLLTSFKTQRGSTPAPQNGPGDSPAPKVETEAQRLQRQRQENLRADRGVRPRSNRLEPAGPPEDFSGSFKFFSKQAEANT